MSRSHSSHASTKPISSYSYDTSRKQKGYGINSSKLLTTLKARSHYGNDIDGISRVCSVFAVAQLTTKIKHLSHKKGKTPQFVFQHSNVIPGDWLSNQPVEQTYIEGTCSNCAETEEALEISLTWIRTALSCHNSAFLQVLISSMR